MDYKQLMVGDWVYASNFGKGKITAYYNADKIRVCLDITNHIFYEEDIKPIHLTPEILEKNGFVWNRYHTSLELVVDTIHLGWGFYKDCISASDWSDEGNCQITSLECKYVHQLQHALKLCGIEKEIVL